MAQVHMFIPPPPHSRLPSRRKTDVAATAVAVASRTTAAAAVPRATAVAAAAMLGGGEANIDFSACTLRQWQTTLKNDKTLLVQGSPRDGKSSWQPWPIGMAHKYTTVVGPKGGVKRLQLGSHTKTVLTAFATHTDLRRRPYPQLNRVKIASTLKKNGFPNTDIASADYFVALPSYKFVVSPEGNGIDCHRHYEALLAGCIPILEHNPLTEEKYKGCPVLYTTDYSEMNEAYLQEKYKAMIDATYDFSRLFLSYYSAAQQAEIKRCGNYWVGKLQNGLQWYPSDLAATAAAVTVTVTAAAKGMPTASRGLQMDVSSRYGAVSAGTAPLKNLNTTKNCCGRMVNHFFLNAVAHFVCQQSNVKFTYGYADRFKALGITFFENGSQPYPHHLTLEIPDDPTQMQHYIMGSGGRGTVKANLYFSGQKFYQNKPFACFLHAHYTAPAQRNLIMAANKYKARYQQNQDYFVHVRLGDVAHNTVGFQYYDMVLAKLTLAIHGQGYIASDSITHPLCQQLVKKYKLEVVQGDEVDTIMFGSTCHSLVLSAGTFSWFIGLLGFFAEVYYPDYYEKKLKIWHRDIYLPHWHSIKGY